MIPRGLIGVVHLPPMPGDPRHAGDGFLDVKRRALDDAEALARGGVNGLLLENFGSVPFSKGDERHRIPPHQVALLALLAGRCKQELALHVGVNCLRNDALSAIGIAAAADLDFVRVNVHIGAYVTDQGLIEGEADRSLRYRQALGAQDVAILADVLVKHAAPLGPIAPAAATRDCLERGLADGVIVTGEATGAPLSRDLLHEVAGAARDNPVYIGSGMRPDRAEDLAPLAHGAIVGTWLKKDGRIDAPVDPARVEELVKALKGRFR
jgi:membrane complex biogenesis BtpA family protein